MKAWKVEHMKSRIEQLLDAIDAWRMVDNDVADKGWNRQNEAAWDDAKDRMTTLADALRKAKTLKGNCIGWCYLCDDSENRENIAYPRFFRSLEKAKKVLKRGFDADCKMFGNDDLNKKETRIAKDGRSAQLQTLVDSRLIHYSIKKIAFE